MKEEIIKPLRLFVAETDVLHEENPHVEVMKTLRIIGEPKDLPIALPGEIYLAYIEPVKECNACVEPETTNSEKPKEWSEEDEKMLEAVIKRYVFAVKSDLAVFIKKENLTELEKELAWLNSLSDNPKKSNNHWKPTEEQMSALYNRAIAVKYVEPELLSLYEDLKKLCE